MVSGAPRWLGAPEGSQLEYKGAEALRDPVSIARAVVALLNHRGGYVVVGVDDQGKPHGLPTGADVGRERDRLRSMLIDSIEPRPLDRVSVQAVQVLGVDVLQVAVARRDSRVAATLYAERRRGMYGFWVRSGATTRSYTLEEVHKHFSKRATPVPARRWDDALAKNDEPDTVFVMQAQFSDVSLERSAIERVFAKDQRIKLHRRAMSWAVIDEYAELEPSARSVLAAGRVGGRKYFSVDSKSAILRFEGRADFLRWRTHPLFGQRVIYPFPLVEGTASFFWLLARYIEESGADGSVHCQLGLWRPEGWRLGPSRPGTIAWETPQQWQAAHDNTSVERIGDRDVEEICVKTDQVARSYVSEVYEDFGYEVDSIPFWSEQEQRFIFE